MSRFCIYKYRKTFPMLEIESEFLRAVFAGRKNWEIRKRLVEPLKPVVIVESFRGWPHVSAVAVFDRAMFGTPASILAQVAESGGDACVDQSWVDRYAGDAKELVAMRYFRIMADGAPVAAIAAAGLGSAKLRNMARAAARRLARDLGHAARNRRNRKARKGGAE